MNADTIQDVADVLTILLVVFAVYASRGKPLWQKIVAFLAVGAIFAAVRVFLTI